MRMPKVLSLILAVAMMIAMMAFVPAQAAGETARVGGTINVANAKGYNNATIIVYQDETKVMETTANDQGGYSLELNTDEYYNIEFAREYCTTYVVENVILNREGMTKNVTLYAGDFNKDGQINASDLSLIIGVFNQENTQYDMNQSGGKINIVDVTAVIGAFNKKKEIETLPSPMQAMKLYVAPSGDDGADGTIDSPLKTVVGARDKVRAIKGAGGLPDRGIDVYFREGSYTLSATVEFAAQDSGEVGKPITYRNYPGETARINGAYVLEGSQFGAITDTAVKNRLQTQDAKNNVLEFDLTKLGSDVLTQIGTIEREHPSVRPFGYDGDGQYKNLKGTAMFSVNNEQKNIARWPNVDDLIYEGNENLDPGVVFGSRGWARYKEVTENTFVTDSPNMANWANTDDVYVKGFFEFNWMDDVISIGTIDKAKSTITLSRRSDYGPKNYMRYYVFNCLEELDSPGEWYVNKATRKLYYYPGANENMATAHITLTKLSQDMLFLNRVSNVNFNGLHFEDSRSSGMIIEGGSKNIDIVGCTFYNLGAVALVAKDSNDITIRSCDIIRTGRGSLYLFCGDVPSLTSGNVIVENCKILYPNTQTVCYTPGIALKGVGAIIRNNEIAFGAHSLITLGGVNHVIENNTIHDAVYWGSDSGVIYGGRTWHERGTVIQNNEFYNAWGHDDRHYGGSGGYPFGTVLAKDGLGIYFDDIMGGNIIQYNIFHDIFNGVFNHGGGDTTIHNNIFYNSPTTIDLRLISGNSKFNQQDERWEAVMATSGFNSKKWYEEFPRLKGIVQDEDRWLPRGNVMTNNLLVDSGKGLEGNNTYRIESGIKFYNAGTVDLETTFQNNWQAFFDPGFVNIGTPEDTANRNLMLTPEGLESVRGYMGDLTGGLEEFQNIDTSKIGPYIDKYRTSLD